MSNKYLELVKIIQKSRENIRPALQGNIFEREMLESDVLRGEEAKMRALEELKQRPEIKITDEMPQKPPVVDDEEEEKEEEEEEEGKEEEREEKGEFTEEELQDKLENHALDISETKLTPKNSVAKMRQSGKGKKYFVINKNEIKIYIKKSKSGTAASPGDLDKLTATIPIVRGKLLYDAGMDNVITFLSLLQKGPEKKRLRKEVKEYVESQVASDKNFFTGKVRAAAKVGATAKVGPAAKVGTGHDPRLLLGAYLAKNNNKQLENLVKNML